MYQRVDCPSIIGLIQYRPQFTECLRYLSVEPGGIRDSEATSVPEVEIVGDDEEVEDLPMDDRFERLAEAMARNDDEAAEKIMQELGYGLLNFN